MEPIDPSSFESRRKILGWSRYKFARRSGVNPQTVHNVEVGRHRPTSSTLRVMEQALREGEASQEQRAQTEEDS